MAAAPHQPPHKVTRKFFKSFDATRIAYQEIGPRTAKTIVLCHGLGGTFAAWRPLYAPFADRYRFLSWDYRGLFHSDPPDDESHMTIPDHVADLKALLDQIGLAKAILAGWSMGVQVALEFYRRHAGYVRAMILINGTYGSPFDTALNSSVARLILPKINELMQKIAPAMQPALRPILRRVVDSKGFISFIAKIGLVHKNLDSKIFSEVAREFVDLDLHMYHEVMKHLSAHSAEDMLGQIKVPVLIIAGDEDIVTPMRVTDKMVQEIPRAEFFLVPSGTHYSLLEFPEIINLRITKFLSANKLN